jgi:hypothetical protein
MGHCAHTIARNCDPANRLAFVPLKAILPNEVVNVPDMPVLDLLGEGFVPTQICRLIACAIRAVEIIKAILPELIPASETFRVYDIEISAAFCSCKAFIESLNVIEWGCRDTRRRYPSRGRFPNTTQATIRTGRLLLLACWTGAGHRVCHFPAGGSTLAALFLDRSGLKEVVSLIRHFSEGLEGKPRLWRDPIEVGLHIPSRDFAKFGHLCPRLV